MSRPQRLAVAGALLVVAIVLLAVGGGAADSTDTAWPGVVVLVGVVMLFVATWLAFRRPRAAAAPVEPTGPGWYPDPDSPSMRFWDGASWTDQRAPLPAGSSSGTSVNKIALGVAAGIVGVLIVVGVIYSAVSANDDLDCSINTANGEPC